MPSLPTILDTGDHASRPAASTATGMLYSCTDHDLIYQSDGSTWSTWATLGGGGGGGALGNVGIVERTAGDLTTTSTTFVDATGITVDVVTGATRCLAIFTATSNNSGADQTLFDLAIDGTRVGETFGSVFNQGSINQNASFSYVTDALSAASHTFKIQWRVTGGTGTLFASTSVTPARLQVIDLGV